MRNIIWLFNSNLLRLYIWIITPARLSGVLSADKTPSIPASAGDIITLVAKPVAVAAAIMAHASLSAVTSTLPAHIGNISAKVSEIFRMFPIGDITMKHGPKGSLSS
jgi:hypothetical protein